MRSNFKVIYWALIREEHEEAWYIWTLMWWSLRDEVCTYSISHESTLPSYLSTLYSSNGCLQHLLSWIILRIFSKGLCLYLWTISLHNRQCADIFNDLSVAKTEILHLKMFEIPLLKYTQLITYQKVYGDNSQIYQTFMSCKEHEFLPKIQG